MMQRELGTSGLKVSEVGLGCEHLQDKPLETVRGVIDAALANGMDILDIFMSEPEVRTNIGIALKGRRDKAVLQGHIGAGWRDGQYFRTRDLAECRFFFDDFMTRLQTDYVDIGMLHFVDTQPDLDSVLQSGMIDYAQDLKKRGMIRAVGVSSHDPIVAKKLVETGAIDVLMFSLNPAFDLMPGDTILDDLFDQKSYDAQQKAFAIAPERTALYHACEAQGVGITVMKALGGGALLSDKFSIYGKGLTVTQCIHYALTRPAVGSVLVGCQTPEEIEKAVAYENATDADRDYASVLSGTLGGTMQGHCVYCNHCLPCPVHIDIAQVNKYLDLAETSDMVPDTVRAHYAALEQNASDCIACGQCESRCPFGVPVIERMQRAAQLFG